MEAIYETRRNHGTRDKFLQNFVAAPDGNNVLEQQGPEGTKKLDQTAQKQGVRLQAGYTGLTIRANVLLSGI